MGLPADITILSLYHLHLLTCIGDVRNKFYCVCEQYHMIFVFDFKDI